jgi:hypothetical protein
MARKIGILISLLIITCVWVCTTPSIETDTIKKHVHLKISDNDFGTVNYNDSYSGSFSVTNTTDQQIELLDIDAGCTCITSKPEKRTLPQFETTKVNYTLAIPKVAGHKVMRKEPVRVEVFVRYKLPEGKANSLSSHIKGVIDKQLHCSHKLLYIHTAVESGVFNTNGNAFNIQAFERVAIDVKVSPPIFVPTVVSNDNSHAVTLAPSQFLNGTHKGMVEITATNKQGKQIGRQVIEYISYAEAITVSPSVVFVDTLAIDNRLQFKISSPSSEFGKLTLESVFVNGRNCTNQSTFQLTPDSICCTLYLPLIYSLQTSSSVEFHFRCPVGGTLTVLAKAYLVDESVPY